MLHIITGRTGSGKTRQVRKMIAETAEKSAGNSILLVPEQFSFETEKAMLEILGNDKINNVEVTSFTRLAEKLLKEEGRLPKKSINDGVRSILMSMAVEDLGKNVSSYERYVTNVSVIHDLVSFRKELKKCCISLEELDSFTDTDANSLLEKRISDVSKIFNVYDAAVNKNYGDDTEYLNLLYDLLNEKHFFKGKTVAIDAFSGFSKQEYNIVENILIDAKDLYITFCYDLEKNNGRYELFHNTTKEIDRLKNSAREYSVKIASQELYVTDKKYKADSLYFLEENLFSNQQNHYDKDASNISIMECQIKKEECDLVAAEIKRLVREENYRYRDIAIIERAEEDYKDELLSSFRKYNIKCFNDNRQPVDTQPLIVFVRSLFQIMVLGFRTELVMQYIKTGLLGISLEDIAMLEDYSYIWNIKQSKWKSEWTANPNGISDRFGKEEIERLERLNEIRKSIVNPILNLKEKIKESNGKDITSNLFNFLKKSNIAANLKKIAEELDNYGSDILSIEQGVIWKLLVEIMDELYYAVGERPVSIKRYYDLFEMLVASVDVGVIPNTIDEVILGSADRIRASAPKAVFIIGANTGVFPKYSSEGVIFNDKERCKIIESGIELVSNMEYNSVNEMFIAYHALTLATDRLYLSYSTLSNNNDKMYPSELVSMVRNITDNKCTEINSKDVLRKVESKASAFSAMATESKKTSEIYSSIYKYFENSGNDQYAKMIDKCKREKVCIDDKKVARELFNTGIATSASRIEKYYKCPYMYFCQYGLKAKAKKRADIDNLQFGTIIHYVMEKVLSENSKESFIKMEDDDLKAIIDKIIDEYLDKNMNSDEGKTQIFLRKIQIINNTAFFVLKALINEFSNCDFIPSHFELNIGKEEEGEYNVKPYLIDFENGDQIKLVGTVDRVDSYNMGGNSYLRIVDYKSSEEKFTLSDIFYGLNMQMLIYLFAIWQNGIEKNGIQEYENIVPSGILYFPSTNKVERKDDRPDNNEENIKYNIKMKGMVLDDISIINAMDHKGKTFITTEVKDGCPKGDVISVEALEKLKDKVNDIIRNMFMSLYEGEINPLPVNEDNKKSCGLCDFYDICRYEEDLPVKEVKKLNHEEALEKLGGESDA